MGCVDVRFPVGDAVEEVVVAGLWLLEVVAAGARFFTTDTSPNWRGRCGTANFSLTLVISLPRFMRLNHKLERARYQVGSKLVGRIS